MKMTDGRPCKRGHVGPRDSGRHCKICKAVTRNRHYDREYETSYARQVSRYAQYKKRLNRRIILKKERLLNYDKEIRNRNGKATNS